MMTVLVTLGKKIGFRWMLIAALIITSGMLGKLYVNKYSSYLKQASELSATKDEVEKLKAANDALAKKAADKLDKDRETCKEIISSVTEIEDKFDVIERDLNGESKNDSSSKEPSSNEGNSEADTSDTFSAGDDDAIGRVLCDAGFVDRATCDKLYPKVPTGTN